MFLGNLGVEQIADDPRRLALALDSSARCAQAASGERRAASGA
jgi:hypothetical protein